MLSVNWIWVSQRFIAESSSKVTLEEKDAAYDCYLKILKMAKRVVKKQFAWVRK